MLVINANTYVFNGVAGLIFDLSLHPHPYFIYASSEEFKLLINVNVNILKLINRIRNN